METQPMQSQTFNINNVSSTQGSALGQCGRENFMHIKIFFREGITEQKSLLCLVKAHTQGFIKNDVFKHSDVGTNKEPYAMCSLDLSSLFLFSKNQAVSPLVFLHPVKCV